MSVSESVDWCEDVLPFLLQKLFRQEKRYIDNKLYICPEMSGEVLTKDDWLNKIQDYIMVVQESDPLLAAILAVKSLNTKHKADECLSIITRYLRNIIQHPENEKYRHIRCLNPIVESKILNTEGTFLFLSKIGFQLETESESAESFLSFYGSHYHLKEVIQMVKDVKGFQLTVCRKTGGEHYGKTCTDGNREDDKFYKLTATDLKKNQKLRELEIEKESTLRTRSTREKEKRLVPKSKITKIRIRSPESLIESCFEITDKLVEVYQFVDEKLAEGRKYTLLKPPATPFKDSDKQKSLVQLQLFPAVLLTVKWVQPDNQYTKGKQ